MDRKRIPADWRKKVAAIRVKISKEFSSLPKDIDPYFQTLDPDGNSCLLKKKKTIFIKNIVFISYA